MGEMAERGDTGGPYLAIATLCEKVLLEGDGTSSLIRVVDRVNVQSMGPEPPAQMPPWSVDLVLVLLLRGGQAKGRDQVVLTMEQPSGQRSHLGTFPLAFEPEERGTQINVNLNLEIEQEGLHWIDLEMRLDAGELRSLFNSIGIADRIAKGELYEVIEKDVTADPKYGQPESTRSQIISYYDLGTREKVFLGHRFLCPDGSIGASGQLDPKRIEHNGILYILKRAARNV